MPNPFLVNQFWGCSYLYYSQAKKIHKIGEIPKLGNGDDFSSTQATPPSLATNFYCWGWASSRQIADKCGKSLRLARNRHALLQLKKRGKYKLGFTLISYQNDFSLIPLVKYAPQRRDKHRWKKSSFYNFTVAAPEFFCGGSRGQKSKNLPKMADFDHFFLLTGGGGKSLQLGGLCPPCPLDAATAILRAPSTVYEIRKYAFT